MSTPLFNKVASLLSKTEFKEFKTESLNPLLKKFTGRTLNPSNLNEMASQLLGAGNSNIVANAIKAKTTSEVKDSFMEQVLQLNADPEFNWMAKSSIIPLFDFSINKERVEMGIEVYYDAIMNEAISLDIYINAPDTEDDETSELASLNGIGGDTLASMSRNYSYNDEMVIEDILRGLGAGEKIKSARIPNVITDMYGIKKSNFSNFSEYESVKDYLNTVLTLVASDINMRLAAKGKAKAIKKDGVYRVILA